MRRFAVVMLSAAFFAVPALAQTTTVVRPDPQTQVAPVVPPDHLHMQPSDTTKPASQAYADINAHMHQAMMIHYTGDPDADFVRSMIPHHEAAVEMAKVVIAQGNDPQVKALAQNIMNSQSAEIESMKGWLAHHAK